MYRLACHALRRKFVSSTMAKPSKIVHIVERAGWKTRA